MLKRAFDEVGGVSEREFHFVRGFGAQQVDRRNPESCEAWEIARFGASLSWD